MARSLYEGDKTVLTSTDKSTYWGFTAYEGQWYLFDTMNDKIREWGWQQEVCPETQRLHYQGYVAMKGQTRFSTMKQIFPGIHFLIPKHWEKWKNYCRKIESAVPGTQVAQTNPSQPMTMAQALTKLALHIPFKRAVNWLESTNPIKENEEQIKHEFWTAVREILRGDPNSVGLWTQPQYFRAWQHTREVWIDLAIQEAEIGVLPLEEETDRQTDIPVYAFEN